MKTIEPFKNPIEYFHKIASLATSKVQEDKNKLLFINVDNAYSKGVSELLPFSNGCFAANTSFFRDLKQIIRSNIVKIGCI